MRISLIFISTFIFLFSCDSKQKYQGVWYGSQKIEITNDSIRFYYPDFNYWNSYPLNTIKDRFEFNNTSVKAEIVNDSLFLNNNSIYTKNLPQNYFKNKIIIRLPELKLNNSSIIDNSNYRNINFHIRYGIRHDTENYSLQLNDKYVDINELIEFINVDRKAIRYETIPFIRNLLFIDRKAKMNDVEKILLVLSSVNSTKLAFVNSINLKPNNSYEYQTLNKRLPLFQVNQNYYKKTLKILSTPPLLPPLPTFQNDNTKTNYFLLIKNKIYYNNTIVEKTGLTKLVKKLIKKNETIFSLYDLESNYRSFLEMNSIINSAYQNIRQGNSKIKYKKATDKLTKEELFEIKKETPMKHIWSYSIPHFKSIIKKDNSFFGRSVENFSKTINY